MSERRGYERIRWLEELQTVDLSSGPYTAPRSQWMSAEHIAIELVAALIETFQPLLEAWSRPQVIVK